MKKLRNKIFIKASRKQVACITSQSNRRIFKNSFFGISSIRRLFIKWKSLRNLSSIVFFSKVSLFVVKAHIFNLLLFNYSRLFECNSHCSANYSLTSNTKVNSNDKLCTLTYPIHLKSLKLLSLILILFVGCRLL